MQSTIKFSKLKTTCLALTIGIILNNKEILDIIKPIAITKNIYSFDINIKNKNKNKRT